MKGLFAAAALLSGAALAFQVGFNNGLRARVGHPMIAALISFGVGMVALAAYVAAARPAVPGVRELARAPWWIWMGGLVGAVYVACAAAFAARLGAAGWLALVVAGQILTSLAMDHFGLVGFERQPITAARLVGAALLLAGVALVLRR